MFAITPDIRLGTGLTNITLEWHDETNRNQPWRALNPARCRTAREDPPPLATRQEMSSLAVPGLVQEIRTYGRFDVNGCLNCGSCTIVCELSGNSASFPRRPIRYTLLGLKEKLRESLEPWLCHDCGDCSTTCPRQAEPRESMMTLRRYLASQYDPTGLASKIYLSKNWEIGALSFLGVLVLSLVYLYHTYIVELPLSDFLSMPMGLEHMFSTIETFTRVVFLIPLFFMIVNAFQMHRFTMRRGEGVEIPSRLYFLEAKTMLVHLFSHKNIRKCVEAIHSGRWTKHWLLGLGCSLMFVILFFFLRWFQTDNIYPIYHPQRLLGYFVTAIMVIVPADILIGRLKRREQVHKFSELSDVTLPILLLLTALSGIAVHLFRYLEFPLVSHFAYAVHLAICVPMLVIEVPFGKWSHMLYRPLAIYFQAVKERAQGKFVHEEAKAA